MRILPERFTSTSGALPMGTSQSTRQNLPLDQYGGVDWEKLREIQLRNYSTAELEAELKRRVSDA